MPKNKKGDRLLFLQGLSLFLKKKLFAPFLFFKHLSNHTGQSFYSAFNLLQRGEGKVQSQGVFT
jgi:hypothetical protein